ncbi:protein of unknown function [Methylorubrum extorquens]|uniref:Uncharacterized protein n=1 Tax=Methylorubrum extorquens TaxID=408 RepID=A0A2N9ATI7_METEX|nr:protein of unknown function [Methylorubrum extorquens]
MTRDEGAAAQSQGENAARGRSASLARVWADRRRIGGAGAKTPEWLTKNEATAALDSTHEVASFRRPPCPRLPRSEGLIPA